MTAQPQPQPQPFELARFKFKYLTADGQEAGFLSKKGSFDGATLTLDNTPIPIEAVPRVAKRFNRLVLSILQQNGGVEQLAIAITGGSARKLGALLNRVTSARWAAMRREALTKKGEGHTFKSRQCPWCDATVELTGHDDSPQMFCPYCDSVVTWRADGPVEEADLHACDGCGLYARPREFTIMYFYFLLVVYGYRYRKVYRCDTCMRPEAWKMLLGNAPFVLGVPVALGQLWRVYTGKGKSFAGLDAANALARRGQVDAAAQRYELIEQRLGHCATVRFNHGLAYANANRWDEAAGQFRAALDDCANFTPGYQALSHSLQQMGPAGAEELRQLREQWDDAPEEPGAAAKPAGEASAPNANSSL